MADPNKPIEEAWERTKPAVVHPLSSPDQVEIMRALFYAGAVAAHSAIVVPPPGKDSFEQIASIEVELDAYEVEVDRNARLASGPTAGNA
jgi:hypothetical protein